MNTRLASAAFALFAVLALSLAGAARRLRRARSPPARSPSAIRSSLRSATADTTSRDYEIDLDYDPASNELRDGTRTTITAVATQNLSRFSLDFQRDLDIDSVTVDGVAAAKFSRADAKPKLSDDPQRDPAGEADDHAGRRDPEGSRVQCRRRLPRRAGGDRRHGRIARGLGPGLLGAGQLRRLLHRQRADRGAELVPVATTIPPTRRPSRCTRPRPAPTRRSAPASRSRASTTATGPARRPGSRTRRWRPTSRPGPSASSTSTTRDDDRPHRRRRRSRSSRRSTAPVRRQRKAGVTATAARIPEMVNFLSRPPRPLPVRDRRARRRLGTRRRLRAREPDEAALRGRQGRPRRPAARRSPTSSPTSGWATTSRPPTWSVIWFNEGWATFAAGPLRSRGRGRRHVPRRSSSAPSTTRSRSSGSWRPPGSTATRPSSSTGSPSTTAPGRCCRACGDHRQPPLLRLRPRPQRQARRRQHQPRAVRQRGQAGERVPRPPAAAARRLRPPVAALGPATAPDPRRLQALTYRTTNQEDPR